MLPDLNILTASYKITSLEVIQWARRTVDEAYRLIDKLIYEASLFVIVIGEVEFERV